MKRYCLFSSALSSAVCWGVRAIATSCPSSRTAFGGTAGLVDRGRGRSLLHLPFLLDAQEPDDRLRPEGEDAGGQPAVEDEGPVERSREDLLEDPQAVGPLVECHLHHFGDGCRDQEGERPREPLVG